MWRVTWNNRRLLGECCRGLCAVPLRRSAGFEAGVLTILDLDVVDVTPSFAEVVRSVLSGVGGSTGGWRCCWDAPSPPQLPPATPNNPPPYINLLLMCFCSDGSNKHKIWVAGGKPIFVWEAGWEEPFGNKATFSCFRNLEILHGHLLVAAYIYGDNA